MARERFVYDRKTRKLVPAAEYYADKRAHTLHLISDLEPYRSVVDGSIIGGRKQHRDHLRAHGCEEVGNEPIFGEKYRKEQTPAPGLMGDIERAFQETGNG